MATWCSDIDGVLVDSRSLVIESYKYVGIDMPMQAWGHPWQTWLPSAVGSHEKARELHEKKTEAYIEVLRAGAALKNALPFAEILRALEHDMRARVFYVTGAAKATATVILQELGLNADNLVAASVTTDARKEILESLDSSGVYIDDRIEGKGPAEEAGWDFIWAKQDWRWKQ
jgi:hypothetical protein